VWRARRHYVALLPIFAILIIFSYYPPVMALYYSFTDFNGVRGEFIGLENFVEMTEDWILKDSVRNLAIFLISGILIGTIPPLIVAELLYAVRSRISGWYRTAFLIPTLIPGISVIMTWRYIYHYRYGMINTTLSAIGLESARHDWLGSYDTALPALIFFGFPWISATSMLILLSALLHVPSELVDAFRLDSSSTLRRVRYIDLPYMAGALRLVLMLTVLGTMQSFGLQFVLTGGGPGAATMVPAYHMYRQAFHGSRFGYASAIGFVLFIVMLTFTVLIRRQLRFGAEVEGD
jgi:raffinose/stachyose/melibiose transport system permease protein